MSACKTRVEDDGNTDDYGSVPNSMSEYETGSFRNLSPGGPSQSLIQVANIVWSLLCHLAYFQVHGDSS